MSNAHGSLAPIGLSAYRRLNHLRKTVTALQQNTLAEQSELYIFSDAPAPGDEEKVEKVRAYLRQIKGFRHVEIVERSENSRVRNNRGGMKQLADCFGRLIFLEEDIVTAPGYLAFMNEALDAYSENPRVLSITGYAAPVKWISDSDVFALPRFCAWGMALTKCNFEKIQPLPEDAMSGLDQAAAEKCGKDVYAMIRMLAEGEIDAFDVMAMYHQCFSGQLTIYPKFSLVENNGHDGSGIHCRATDRFHNPKLWEKGGNFNFPPEPDVLEGNLQLMREFRESLSAKKPKWKRWLKKLRGY